MKNKLFKASIGYTICNIFLKCISFLTVPIFSRLLSTEEYGLYNSYLAYETILFVFIGLSIHSSLKNANIEFKNNINKYCSSVLIIPIINLIIFLLIGNFIYPLISEFLGFSKLIFFLLIIHAFSTAILTFYNEKIALKYQYNKFMKIAFINSISNVVISVFLIFTFFSSNRLVGRVIGTVAPLFILSLLIISSFFKVEKPKINKKYWRFGVFYSLPIILHSVSQTILSQFDRIMIQNMVDATSAGIYSLTYTFGMLLQTIGYSICTAWGPFFYEQYDLKKYSVIKSKSKIYIKIFAILCIGGMFVCPEILKIVTPKSYWEGQYCIAPIILSSFYIFLYNFPAQVEYYHKKTNFIALGTILAAIFNMITNFIFINRYGYMAATYTTLVSYILYFIAHMYIAKKISGLNLFDTKYIVFISFILIICMILVEFTIKLLFFRYFILFLILLIILLKNKDIIKLYWRVILNGRRT